MAVVTGGDVASPMVRAIADLEATKEWVIAYVAITYFTLGVLCSAICRAAFHAWRKRGSSGA